MTGFITLFLFFLLQVRSWMEELLIGINEHIVSYTIGLDSLKASSNSSNCIEDIRLRMDGLFEQKEHALLFVKEFTALYTNGPAGGGGIRLMHTHNCPFLKFDYLKFVYIVISFKFTIDLFNWFFHTLLYTNHVITYHNIYLLINKKLKFSLVKVKGYKANKKEAQNKQPHPPHTHARPITRGPRLIITNHPINKRHKEELNLTKCQRSSPTSLPHETSTTEAKWFLNKAKEIRLPKIPPFVMEGRNQERLLKH